MIHIPKDQPKKHPDLYPEPKSSDEYAAHIIEMCDNANDLHRKRKMSEIPSLKELLNDPGF